MFDSRYVALGKPTDGLRRATSACAEEMTAYTLRMRSGKEGGERPIGSNRKEWDFRNCE